MMMNKWLSSTAMLAADGVGGGGTSPTPSSGASGGGGGSTAATPSSSSGASSSAPASPSSGGSDHDQGGDAPPDNFEMFFRDDGSPPPGMESGEAPPAQPPAVATAPAAPPPVAAPPGAPPAATPVQATEAPAASPPQPASAPAAAALDPYDPVSLGQHLANNEDAATQFVAENMFKLSPEEVEAIETDVIGTIPKLLGKVFVKSQANVLAQMGRMIPTMVQRHTEAMIRNKEGEDKFYQRWPELNPAQHGKLATQYAVAYRGMNPNATMEQMIEAIGPYVMMAAGVAPGSMGVAGQQPRQGAAPRAPSNGRQPPPTPFVPAGASGGPASHSTTPQLEPWEALFRPQGE